MCWRKPDIDFNAVDKDKSITQQLQHDKKRLNEEIRLLLLGAGESGKSTILKQLKIIHKGGFNPEEKLNYIPLIHSNIHESVSSIFQASLTLNIPLSLFALSLSDIFTQPYSTIISPQLGEKLIKFWNDESVLEVLARRAEFQILDNTSYYCEHLERICAEGFVPTEMDIVQSRIQTTGIIEASFVEKGKRFIIIDVGGQRSERKKWIHIFENVSGVLYCVGLSCFDQTLREDNTTNRMIEALHLFDDIVHSPWFHSSAMILFLNKSDLFKEKLESGKSISNIFPEFDLGSDYDGSINFIKNQFIKVTDPENYKKKSIYTHVTNATDTENVRFVFQALRDFIIKGNLQKAGFI